MHVKCKMHANSLINWKLLKKKNPGMTLEGKWGLFPEAELMRRQSILAGAQGVPTQPGLFSKEVHFQQFKETCG